MIPHHLFILFSEQIAALNAGEQLSQLTATALAIAMTLGQKEKMLPIKSEVRKLRKLAFPEVRVDVRE